MEFLKSPLFGNIILILTVLVTLFIWHNDKKQKIKSYAQLLLLQIRSIENGITEIQTNGLDREFLNESPFLAIPILFDKNYWDEYSHLLLNKLGVTDYEVISNFYEKSSRIKENQIEIKNKMKESLYWRGYHIYNSKYSVGLDISKDLMTVNQMIDVIKDREKVLGFSMYIPGEYPKQILKLLETYKPLRGTVAYSKLEELSKIKVF